MDYVDQATFDRLKTLGDKIATCRAELVRQKTMSAKLLANAEMKRLIAERETLLEQTQ